MTEDRLINAQTDLHWMYNKEPLNAVFNHQVRISAILGPQLAIKIRWSSVNEFLERAEASPANTGWEWVGNPGLPRPQKAGVNARTTGYPNDIMPVPSYLFTFYEIK